MTNFSFTSGLILWVLLWLCVDQISEGQDLRNKMSTDSETRAPPPPPLLMNTGRAGEIKKTTKSVLVYSGDPVLLKCSVEHHGNQRGEMADSLKGNSWNNAGAEDRFFETDQEPTHFILIILLSLFQLFYWSGWNSIKWLVFNASWVLSLAEIVWVVKGPRTGWWRREEKTRFPTDSTPKNRVVPTLMPEKW